MVSKPSPDLSESEGDTGTTSEPLEVTLSAEALPSPSPESAPENLEQTSRAARPAYHPTVHDIPLDDRPRERLQKYGADSLALSELLAERQGRMFLNYRASFWRNIMGCPGS